MARQWRTRQKKAAAGWMDVSGTWLPLGHWQTVRQAGKGLQGIVKKEHC